MMGMRVWALVVLCAVAVPLSGEEFSLKNVSINGYGTWYYGRTDNSNLYFELPEVGSYRTAEGTLSVAAAVNDHLRILTQANWQNGPNGDQMELDFLFAEWKFNDHLQGRVGKSKMPFGIYGEIADVGTLRPFLALPQAAYGPAGFLGDNYKGVGVTGSFGSRWNVQWDVYGGGMELTEDTAPELYLLGQDRPGVSATETEVTRDVLGGRMVVATPVAGLSVGASLLRGTETGVDRRRTVYGLQAEYSAEALTVRAETMHEEVTRDLKSTGSYVEASYRLTDHWQAAAEAGRLRTDFFGVQPTGLRKNLTRHDEAGVGLNYWFGTNLVIKVNYLRIKGNEFAHPAADDLPGAVAEGSLKPRTNVFLAGAQFSF
jgi:hypothetical protein